MNVFISSVITGYEEYREAALRGIELLGHSVVRSEAMSAQARSPQRACVAEAREADTVVLLVGSRYGNRQKSGLSATHEEYRAVRDTDKVLVFVQDGVTREDAQGAFLKEVEDWSTGHLTRHFDTPEELTEHVVKGLHQFEVERATGIVNDQELLHRAETELKVQMRNTGKCLVIAVTPGPVQTLVRPAALDPKTLGQEIAKELTFGREQLFALEGWQSPSVQDERLVLIHKDGCVTLDAAGSLVIRQPAQPTWAQAMLRPIVEEDIREKLAGALRFTARVLDIIDPTEKASAVVVMASITNPDSWVTRAEYEANPGHLSLSQIFGRDNIAVHLSPAVRRRRELTADSDGLGADLLVLLRRKIKGR